MKFYIRIYIDGLYHDIYVSDNKDVAIKAFVQNKREGYEVTLEVELDD